MGEMERDLELDPREIKSFPGSPKEANDFIGFMRPLPLVDNVFAEAVEPKYDDNVYFSKRDLKEVDFEMTDNVYTEAVLPNPI